MFKLASKSTIIENVETRSKRYYCM